MTRKNKLILGICLIAGLTFVVLMVQLKQPPNRAPEQVVATPVRVLEIRPQLLQTEARGYGQVLPAQSWMAVANVGGRITWRHPDLDSGNLITAGTHLLQIDPTRYELAIASAQADLAGTAAELRTLVQEGRNTRKLLDLEERRLALAEREMARATTLAERDALSQTRLDEQQRATLQQEQAVQGLKNQLSLIPVRQDTLEARQARITAALANARQDLEDTRFVAPWDIRVHQSNVDTGQHVSPGQTLFVADDISRAEATVQLQIAELRRVLSQVSAGPAQTDHPDSINSFDSMRKQLHLASLQVWLHPTSTPDSLWSGHLTRITSSLDPATRTVQAVISVDEPYRNANPPARPPLVRNMFVQASIAASTPEPVIAVPAGALHQDVVYLVDTEHRLKRQQVTLAWRQGDWAIIEKGLQAGDLLILDDLVPAIEGMPLDIQKEARPPALPQEAVGDLP